MTASRLVTTAIPIPNAPYPGINPFRVADEKVFFGRTRESVALFRLITIYRAVLLYGASGAGKSSLLNAGFIPLAHLESYTVQKVRVQPLKDQEFSIESISLNPNGGPPYLKTVFGTEEASCISARTFEEKLATIDKTSRVILIFDQFEELVTLFEAPHRQNRQTIQSGILQVLLRLIRDQSRPLKFIFSFREDYLASLMRHFIDCPNLTDQYLHLDSPAIEDLDDIIRGPFRNNPGHFKSEISQPLADRLKKRFSSRSQRRTLSLSEVQICCLKLWQSEDPDQLFAKIGIRGLLEEYLSESLLKFDDRLREPAIALLSRLVTVSGTRNVISKENLINWTFVEEGLNRNVLADALRGLEVDAKLVQRERRRDLDYYEISSEFLVPWIKQQKNERLRIIERRKLLAASEQKQRELDQVKLLADEQKSRAEEQAHANRRLRRITAVLVLVIIGAIITGFYAWKKNRETIQAARISQVRELIAESVNNLYLHPELSLLLAFHAAPLARISGDNIVNEALDVLNRAVMVPQPKKTLSGHTDRLINVAYSRDGRYLATASQDKTAKLWDVQTGMLIHTLKGHEGTVSSVEINSDGTYIATASWDGTVKLWNSRTGIEQKTFTPPLGRFKEGIFGVFFPKAGTRLGVILGDGTIKIWDTESGHEVASSPLPLDRGRCTLRAIALNPELDATAFACDDNVIRIVTGASYKELVGHSDSIRGLAFNISATQLASASSDRTAIIWDTTTGNKLHRLQGHSNAVSTVKFSDDGKQLVTSSTDGSAKVWDVSTSEQLLHLPGHSNAVNAAAWSPDGKHVVTAGWDKTAKIWSIPSSHTDEISSIAFSADDKRVATASFDGTAKVWDTETGENVSTLSGHDKSLEEIVFSPDTTEIATAGDDGQVIVWNAASGRPIRTLIKHSSTTDHYRAYSVAYNRDGSLLATGNDNGTMQIWDPKTGIEQKRLQSDKRRIPVRGLAFSADDRHLASAIDNDALVWDYRAGNIVLTLSGHNSPIMNVKYDPAGKRLVTASMDGTAKLWDANSGTLLATFHHTHVVNGVGFSPDGTRIATGSWDRSVKIWNADSGKELYSFSQAHRINALMFSNDGKRLGVASQAKTIGLFNLDVDEVLRAARSKITRDLTPDECAKYLHQEECPSVQ